MNDHVDLRGGCTAMSIPTAAESGARQRPRLRGAGPYCGRRGGWKEREKVDCHQVYARKRGRGSGIEDLSPGGGRLCLRLTRPLIAWRLLSTAWPRTKPTQPASHIDHIAEFFGVAGVPHLVMIARDLDDQRYTSVAILLVQVYGP